MKQTAAVIAIILTVFLVNCTTVAAGGKDKKPSKDFSTVIDNDEHTRLKAENKVLTLQLRLQNLRQLYTSTQAELKQAQRELKSIEAKVKAAKEKKDKKKKGAAK